MILLYHKTDPPDAMDGYFKATQSVEGQSTIQPNSEQQDRVIHSSRLPRGDFDQR